jgi:hypothetical protein
MIVGRSIANNRHRIKINPFTVIRAKLKEIMKKVVYIYPAIYVQGTGADDRHIGEHAEHECKEQKQAYFWGDILCSSIYF